VSVAISTKQPTVEQAVEILLKLITRAEPARNIAFWREKFGDEFANQVRERAAAAWKTRKK